MAISPDRGSASPERRDGRHARSDRSRDAILEAAIACIRETGEAPTAEDLAARAGVSRRTLFRVFSDVGSMHIAMSQRMMAELLERFPLPGAGLSLGKAIEQTVAQRTGAYAFIRPFRRIADRLAAEKPEIMQSQLHGDRALLQSLKLTFAEYVDPKDDDTWDALAWLTSWSSWAYLTDVRRLSPKRVRGVMRGAIQKLLDA